MCSNPFLKHFRRGSEQPAPSWARGELGQEVKEEIGRISHVCITSHQGTGSEWAISSTEITILKMDLPLSHGEVVLIGSFPTYKLLYLSESTWNDESTPEEGSRISDSPYFHCMREVPRSGPCLQSKAYCLWFCLYPIPRTSEHELGPAFNLRSKL